MPVPTLRYVWSNDRVRLGEVIDSPYIPGLVRSIVVRNGTAHAGSWIMEQRNVATDFQLAFGKPPPPDGIQAIVLFTYNDQTNEPVESFYRSILSICSEA